MTLLDHFAMLARYNTAANRILYDACARLPEEELKRERRAFFRSIQRTLNHILLGDRIWLARFEGRTVASTNLDAILYEDFAALRSAREAEDARIERFVGHVTPAFLAGAIRYVNNSGKRVEDANALLLAHLFNHQTHHRGQVHDMLSQTELPPPSLDMHRVINPI